MKSEINALFVTVVFKILLIFQSKIRLTFEKQTISIKIFTFKFEIAESFLMVLTI